MRRKDQKFEVTFSCVVSLKYYPGRNPAGRERKQRTDKEKAALVAQSSKISQQCTDYRVLDTRKKPSVAVLCTRDQC